MKYDTIETIAQLDELILAKTDRINALNRMIIDARRRYATMTDAQLNEAVRDVAGMKREISEHNAWIEKAQARIAKFYAPATAA